MESNATAQCMLSRDPPQKKKKDASARDALANWAAQWWAMRLPSR
jgi:hypothetical protein